MRTRVMRKRDRRIERDGRAAPILQREFIIHALTMIRIVYAVPFHRRASRKDGSGEPFIFEKQSPSTQIRQLPPPAAFKVPAEDAEPHGEIGADKQQIPAGFGERPLTVVFIARVIGIGVNAGS